MKKATVSLSSLLATCALLACVPAAGASPAADPAPDRMMSEGVQVAQVRPEVYLGPNGERVYVDPYTGEVIGVERLTRRELRRLRNRGYDPRDAYDMRDPYRDEGGFARVPEDRARRAYPGAQQYGRADPDEYRDETDGMPEPRRVERTPLEPAPKPEKRVTSVEGTDSRSTGSVSKVPAAPELKAAEPALPASSGILIAKVQVLLDRLGVSPGAIDGVKGSNVAKALAAYQEMHGKALDVSSEKKIDEMLEANGGSAFVSYTITNEDAAGPYVASVPADYGEKAKLEKMAFTSPAEAIAEKFHMDEAYLKALNPGKNFNQPGTVVKVANPLMRVLTPVARIVADKGRTQVRAYDQQGRLVAAYPATIGSSDTPSPSGTVTVERVAFNPEYTYNPKKNFQQGANDKVLTIPPGPNGPVGSIWIALSKPTYGIHGTPEPSRIGKTNSHGCVRLTNWDADELARLVKPGVFVQFID